MEMDSCIYQIVRTLKANEIECRVSVVKENGLSLDARVDQRILDETFGPFGWQRSHQCIEGNLYCTVSVYDKESGIWIAKQDVGTTGYTEKEKSQASDSFKRACFNWGIGRELYSAPFIWIPAGSANIKKDNNKGRLYCNDRFSVQSIGYNQNREINALTIINDSCSKQVVYQMKITTAPPSSVHELILFPHTWVAGAEIDMDELASIVKIVNDSQVPEQDILSYHVYRYSRENEEITITA